MAAPEREAAAAPARAVGREMKASERFKSELTPTWRRAVGWAAIGVALFITLGADDIRPAGGSMSAEWSDVARPAR